LIFYAQEAATGGADRKSFQKNLNKVTKHRHSPLDHWHFNPDDNPSKTLIKALNRHNLMLSKIVPTVTLEPEQIVRMPPDQIELATDGAGEIAPDLLLEIYESYCEQTGQVSDGTVPSTLQFRLASLKGTLSVNPLLKGVIRYRGHQKKFEIALPTPEQLTVEVCEFATDPGPARMNQQAIRLLEACLPRGHFGEVMTEILREALIRDSRALTDPVAADALCKSAGLSGADIAAKLDSGFDDEHELVQAALRRTMHSDANRAFNSGKMPHSFRLPKSRYQMIIPDRFGLLKEDEVLLKVPRLEHFNKKIVLQRSPCYAPGELLLLTGIDPYTLSARAETKKDRQDALEWYSLLQSVTVLSVQGPEDGVASKMQGGDYDGDKATAIWDERITAHFKPWAAMEYTDPVKEPLLNSTIDEYDEDELDEKLWECMEHLVREQGGEPMIALISRLHSAHADQAASQWAGEAKALLLRLADLAHKAIDMDTAGYIVDRDDDALRDVPAPRYCFHSAAAMPSVFVGLGSGQSGLDDEALRRAFADRYETTKMAHVINRICGSYGFVFFGSAKDMNDALKRKTITIRGHICVINPNDSKDQKREEADAARPPQVHNQPADTCAVWMYILTD